MKINPGKLHPLSIAISTLLVLSAGGTYAQEAGLQQVKITEQKDTLQVTPSLVKLEAIQPQSIISEKYISENASAGSNYSDIVNIAPSVFSIDPNGTGLMESQSLTIRGFQDGQYNVTFDGIPWGDSNDFTHHSTVYFMPQDMGNITIDRGPGDASTIGNATFGGSIALTSKSLMDKGSQSVFGSYGSWNTKLVGIQRDSGLSTRTDDSKFYFSLKDLSSDGFLTNSGQQRQNFFLKNEKEINSDTTLTVVAMLNHTLQHTPYGSTVQQQKQFGYNLGLVNSRSSESNSAWNYDELNTDFEYVGIKTNLSSWKLDNKLYTYAYHHDGYYGANTGSITLADTQNDGGTANGPNNVPGAKMHNNYRSFGDILSLSKTLGSGNFQVGLWYDHQNDSRFEQQLDLTTGGTNPSSGTISNGVDRDMQNTLVSIQTYAKYDWNLTSNWTTGFGLKYASFTRDLNAAVNQKTLLPYKGSETWTKALPSLNTNYKVTQNTSVYAQYSEGFLAPNLNVFYKTTPNLASVQPTTTKNYQIGSNYSDSVFNGGLAIYRITSTNLATAVACPSNVVGVCYNVSSGVTFDGIELEGSRKLTNSVSLYANAAQNNYTTQDGSVLQNTPKTNAGLGFIYQAGPWYGSIMTKYVGNRYSNIDANGNNLTLPGYAIVNLTARYKNMGEVAMLPKDSQLAVKVGNLLNKQGNFASLNSTSSGDPLYFVIPSRSLQVNLDLPF
jgi:iron complex outermembrane recepter protein